MKESSEMKSLFLNFLCTYLLLSICSCNAQESATKTDYYNITYHKMSINYFSYDNSGFTLK